MTKKRHVTYSGELAKPMPAQPKFGLLATQEQINLATDAHKAEFFRRMMLLCDHYEIEAGNWIMLACLLARDHVPGLQTMRDRPGPKMKWGPYTAARAKLAIEYVTTTHSCTQLDAAKRLFRRTIWAKQSPSAPSLLRRAQEADEHWVQMVDHAIRYQCGKAPGDEITLADIERFDL